MDREDFDAELGVAGRIRSGGLGVNCYNLDCAASFGGPEESGLGRERGPEGLSPYLEIKSILVPKNGGGVMDEEPALV